MVRVRLSGSLRFTLNMTDVDSSMIFSVGYDAAANTLRVLFTSGRTCEYREVPLGSPVADGFRLEGQLYEQLCDRQLPGFAGEGEGA
jgi:hypothetical protein